MNLRQLKAYTLGAIGAIGLLAAFVTNLETLLAFADRVAAYFRPPPSLGELYIQADGPLAQPIEKLSDEYGFRISARDYEKGYRYSLAVNIEARFGDPAFNSVEFLKGVAPLSLVEPSGEEVRVAIRDRHPLRVRFSQTYLDWRWGPAYKGAEGNDTRSVKWTAYVKHKQKPKRPAKYTFRSGPKEWTLTLSEMDWRSFPLDGEGEERWWGAQGSAFVVLDDPDWVALRSARVLQLAGGDGSLLEAVIDNRSSVAIPLSALTLRAAQRKRIFCHSDTSMRPRPRQEVTVNWSRLIDHDHGDDDGAVRTRLRHEAVRVEAFYHPENCQKPATFEAEVPLEVTIPPGELARISLKIDETGASESVGRGFELAGWETLLVSVAPEDRVSPPAVLVGR